MYAQLLRLRGDLAAAEQTLSSQAGELQQAWPAPHIEQIAWAQWRAQLALDRGDPALARELLARVESQQKQLKDIASPEFVLLRARLACTLGDFPRCIEDVAAADAGYAAFLPTHRWPRRLTRAWQARAQACARPASTDMQKGLALAIQALAAERPASPERDALRGACR